MNNNNTHKSHEALPIRVPFPPPIGESELQPTLKKGKLPIRATNQFLLYRTAYIKTMRENGYQDINMRVISKLASDSWNLEPPFVQQEYKSLALRAKGLHQKTIKYLTSLHLEDTISQRPLAPMPVTNANSPPDISTDQVDRLYVADNVQSSQQITENVFFTPSHSSHSYYMMGQMGQMGQDNSYYPIIDIDNGYLPYYEYYI
ncbi:8174_t:CDS:1 [Funneliformis geosporum]|uniref:7792_t:CDS:1 n=1 Tax=Funneliformis geosporum TaxID=1117311 RepID=A0A9W4STH9_9GLOM|nr:8174_t:CDS:1 [Funneliformis geosporum]CAI2179961.1 7792_t:CDS:1 [Funneliformis geosporum]